MISIEFDQGSLILRGSIPEAVLEELDGLCHDPRIEAWRIPAYRYDQVILGLRRHGLIYDDQARQYEELNPTQVVVKEPRDYQLEAVAAWRAASRRGTVVLPTGAGKSYVAVMAILDRPRSTLVVAPTIDLMTQWQELLSTYLGVEVGMIGGGSYQVEPITVTTYDSAYIHLAKLGNRFGLVIFDEVHHLPGPSFATAAQLAIAPFRLGLTATPERPDGRDQLLPDLVGPIVYRRGITELAGDFLSEYRTETILVDLDEAERQAYDRARGLFRDFIDRYGIRLGGRGGWGNFLRAASSSDEGRRAFAAWREQRRISQAAPRKLAVLKNLLHQHRKDRVLVFTNDNATVYEISRRFLVPAITHQTKAKERLRSLQRFNSGEANILVASRVLNEGVNVPEANVGIVLSGSATVREHVQRLGRILRKVEGKEATLYEMVARNTSEEATSQRRRQHDAYR